MSDSPPRNASNDTDPLAGLLPHAEVSSRWWYWIAAVPLYVVVAAVGLVIFFITVLTGVAIDIEFAVVGSWIILIPVVGLSGVIMTVMFPVAIYIDSRAISKSQYQWTPDSRIWGIAALGTVIGSVFTLSIAVALYYLYRRHNVVGTP
jgi:hypothetical protein